MEKVTGIGGFFFRSKDPDALTEWYKTHLGMDIGMTPWGQTAGPTVFQPFAQDSDYFPARQPFMINFRVKDLDKLIGQLEAADIQVETREDWNSVIGRFARIHDPEGNPIELWEPSEMVRDRMGV